MNASRLNKSLVLTMIVFLIGSVFFGFIYPPFGNLEMTDTIPLSILYIFQAGWFIVSLASFAVLFITRKNLIATATEIFLGIYTLNILLFGVNLFACLFYISLRLDGFHPM
ncbi:hypothetical protein IV487_13125 [Enterococcus saccharolyticus]|uniref:Uncharacterized protein n=1 Tax=Candidatus Enterococcus willemsii TaxID=1857215 RepID=A0ABQ6Z1D4_9ENTE|nr:MULTISPECIES: hypothetical protein [Enterococcus]KAF1305213.1 hypothetical protein BAU17_12620 [Enterococcus sp. CU12B]MCD5003405.1 hypothetical protein [Enterococcus saccharolyticus]